MTGGRNGYGAKLTNIFSKKFTIETADSKTNLIYKQVFQNNMRDRGEPSIRNNTENENYTRVTFELDLERFKMKSLDEDIISLLTKSVYDMAGVTPASLKVIFNGVTLPVQNFSAYVDLYLHSESNLQFPKIVAQCTSERWEVVCSLGNGY